MNKTKNPKEVWAIILAKSKLFFFFEITKSFKDERIRNKALIIIKFDKILKFLKNKISLKDLTLKCQFLIKRKIKIKKISRTSIFDIPYYVTDNRIIKKVYNWEPKLNINIVLSDIYKWLKSNNKLLNYFK